MKRTRILIALLMVLLLTQGAFAAEKKQVRVAVIDSGISTRAIGADRLAEGKNYVFPELSTEDLSGHGTAVASIIVGSETAGIEGLCPEAVLIPMVYYTITADGEETYGDVNQLAQIIRDAVDIYDCDIINISSAARIGCEALEEAIRYARENGVLVVSVSGNRGTITKLYPGAYEATFCIGAVDPQGEQRAEFSSWNDRVDLLAPGVALPVAQLTGERTEMDGTSFSAAYISGVAAKLMSEYPELTAAQIEQILCACAKDIGPAGYDMDSGWGVVDVDKAMEYAAQGRLFRDVSKDDWFFREVQAAARSGLLRGTDAVSFSPRGTTTRAMLWVMLYRAEGLPASENAATWYSDAQSWMIKTGISDGTEPNKAISREQMATILWRYAQYKGHDVSVETDISGYGDAAHVSPWAESAMRWTCGAGIINGAGGMLLPGENADRAQTAAILTRFLKL